MSMIAFCVAVRETSLTFMLEPEEDSECEAASMLIVGLNVLVILVPLSEPI